MIVFYHQVPSIWKENKGYIENIVIISTRINQHLFLNSPSYLTLTLNFICMYDSQMSVSTAFCYCLQITALSFDLFCTRANKTKKMSYLNIQYILGKVTFFELGNTVVFTEHSWSIHFRVLTRMKVKQNIQ